MIGFFVLRREVRESYLPWATSISGSWDDLMISAASSFGGRGPHLIGINIPIQMERLIIKVNLAVNKWVNFSFSYGSTLLSCSNTYLFVAPLLGTIVVSSGHHRWMAFEWKSSCWWKYRMLMSWQHETHETLKIIFMMLLTKLHLMCVWLQIRWGR